MTLEEQHARLFHDTYEAFAPAYGYETREDTKEFDPESKNGKLMMAVCGFVIKTILQERADVIRGEEVEEDEAKFADDPDNKLSEGYSIGYNQALETAALLVEEPISSKKD